MTYTTEELRTQKEIERIQGAHREQYRIDLYKRYTGKDPEKKVYIGFKETLTDGKVFIFTIHYRTDNTRPYAIYQNGMQIYNKTYIKRFYLEKVLKQLAQQLKQIRPNSKIEHLYGREIIT